jgi:uncharacterized membrane protein
MNKTEYMNTLKQELTGLPTEVIEETLQAYERKFAVGYEAGSTEAEVAAKLPNPRLIAAQQRANARFKHLKQNFQLGNLFGLFIAMIGLMVFNFFMIVPAILYGAFLFVTYALSLCTYGLGVGIIAASLSGTPELQFNLPGHHYRVTGHEMHYGHGRHSGNVSVDISERGITVNEDGKTISGSNMIAENTSFASEGKHQSTMTIKNRMGAPHLFLGVGILFVGTCLLLLCLFMTRLSFIGFRKYLFWNLSLLRAPLHA